MAWLKVFISGWANTHAIPMDEKKATISAINAHLTRKRSSESMNEVKMGACWADDTFVVLLRGAPPGNGPSGLRQ